MTVHTLVRHHCAEKDQIGAEKNVGDHQNRMGDWDEECADREQHHERDDSAAEMVDLRALVHGGSVEKVKGFLCRCVAVE